MARPMPTEPFPAPPPFWKQFTQNNIDKLAAFEVDPANKDKPVPFEIAYLRPPPPPPATDDTYEIFNLLQSISGNPELPPEETLLFDPKSPTFNPADALTKLTRSVLLNFMELTMILGIDPVQWEEKMKDVTRLMYNIHGVINMYRPHQAREGVKEMLEAKLEDGKREIELCHEMSAKVESYLKSLERHETTSQQGTMQTKGSKSTDDDDEALVEQRKLWTIIHNIEDD